MDQRPTIEHASLEHVAELTVLARLTYAAAFGASFAAADLAAHLERHLSLDQIRGWVTEDSVIVMRVAGTIVGYCQFGRAGPGTFEVRRLYVIPTCQNQGLGTQLLRSALNRPELRQARRVLIDVWDQNEGARRLYERFGFRTVGRKGFRVASGEVTGFDLVMELVPGKPELPDAGD